MSNDSPASVVGNKFVLEYYSTLSKNPELISKYYTSDSVMSRGQASFEDEKQNSIQSSSALEGIQNAINTTNFKNCNFNLSGINCQKSFHRGVLLVVHGTIALKDQNHPRQFMQTFFLAPQTEPLYSYYVLNDIFNFIVTPPPAAVPVPTVAASSKAVEEVHIHAPVQQQAANLPVIANNNNNNNNNQSNGTHQLAANVSPIPAPTTTHVAVVHPTATPVAPATTNNNNNNNNASSSTATNAAAPNTTATTVSPIPPATNNNAAANTTAATTTPAPAATNTTKDKSTKDNKNKNANASNGTAKTTSIKQQQPVEQTKPRSPSWANVVNVGNSNGVQPNQIPLPSTPPLIKNKANRSNSASGGSSSNSNGRTFKKGDKEKLQGAKHERSIYVGNLPFSCKEDEVSESFKVFGQIYEIVLKDSGYCFVQYYTPDSASKALGFKEKMIIGGRDLTIEPRKAEANDRPKKNKQKAQQ